MTPLTHPDVMHPSALIADVQECKSRFVQANDRFAEWVNEHVLASLVVFDSALILPLLILPAPDWAKITLGVVSSNWFQWWALPALQRSAMKTQRQNDAKADVDHHALTYLAQIQDEQLEILKRLDPKETT